MERKIEVRWDMRTGDAEILQENSIVGVVNGVEKLEVHKHGEVILTHATGTVTVYNVRMIRYIGPMIPQAEVDVKWNTKSQE